MRFFSVDTSGHNDRFDFKSAGRYDYRKILTGFNRLIEGFNSHNAVPTSVWFLDEQYDDEFIFSVITGNDGLSESEIQSFIDFIDIGTNLRYFDEITLISFMNSLQSAERKDNVRDSDKLLAPFRMTGMDCFDDLKRRIEMCDEIYEPVCRDAIEKRASEFLVKDDLIEELDRIYSGSTGKTAGKAAGHPVHYIIESDDYGTHVETTGDIVSALLVNKRLSTGRTLTVQISDGDRFGQKSFKSMYKACSGGTVVLDLCCCDLHDGEYADSSSSLISFIARTAVENRHQVLTIFRLPRECTAIKKVIFGVSGEMTYVDIRERTARDESACEFLRTIGKQRKIRTNKALFSMVEPGREYAADELRIVFDDWYNRNLKMKVYPQYSELESVRKEVLTDDPKGTAYDQLKEMIGLTSAKAVIDKAISFNKLQTAFASKGIKYDKPAMHMIFTGSPGTAKTTVARLFAKIMQENNILSKGHLVEVGRGDLVGKYVGWTAQQVKAKFAAASGGVLFIDEAYSLVDDKSGMFGDEAINTIVQEMENHRSDLIVVFAGYTDKMEDFLNRNPGLRSRIAFHVPFDDYTADELCDISKLIGRDKGVSFTEEALEKLRDVFESERMFPDFGNGRYARNMVELAKMALAERIVRSGDPDVSLETLTTITEEDIPEPKVRIIPEVRRIGFAC